MNWENELRLAFELRYELELSYVKPAPGEVGCDYGLKVSM